MDKTDIELRAEEVENELSYDMRVDECDGSVEHNRAVIARALAAERRKALELAEARCAYYAKCFSEPSGSATADSPEVTVTRACIASACRELAEWIRSQQS